MRYAAFISYSHRDRDWARWLHRAIETYRPPKRSQAIDSAGGNENRLAPIFLDREELSSGNDLAASVRTALEASRFLIVVCSPAAADSKWVNEEIRSFKALGREQNILCLIVAGEPTNPAGAFDNDQQCFPAALRFVVENGEVTSQPAAEPLAADVRPGMDHRRDARLKIIAGLLGVPLDDLKQREQVRRQRRLAIFATASAVGCLVLAALAATAWFARNEAEAQRRIAEQQSLTARRTADFMKSLFALSDPSEARGNSITAREVLDRGVVQIREGLADEPLVQADLATTLGEVYTGLGLLRAGADLLGTARAVPGQPLATRSHQTTALAEVETLLGNDVEADRLFREAIGLMTPEEEADPALLSRALVGRGSLLSRKERFDEARDMLARAIEVATRDGVPNEPLVVRAIEGLAQAEYDEGRYAEAQQTYERALGRRIALSGEFHPRVSETLNALGSVAYMNGDAALAIDYFTRTLEVDRKVLGNEHPDVAGTMQNLARVLLERHELEKAEPLLEDALRILLAELGETHFEQPFTFSNLALVKMGLGKNAEAEDAFGKALRSAIENRHRTHGPILTDFADLDCRTGRYDEGLRRLDEAEPIVAAEYPDEPWRTAHVHNVRAACLTGVARLAEAEALMESSLSVVLERWDATSLFGKDALTRAALVYTATNNRERLAAVSKSVSQRGQTPP